VATGRFQLIRFNPIGRGLEELVGMSEEVAFPTNPI